MTIPKVQVVCITYNHEKYIAEALNSFVRQNTNFPYEVLVGDDCSRIACLPLYYGLENEVIETICKNIIF